MIILSSLIPNLTNYFGVYVHLTIQEMCHEPSLQKQRKNGQKDGRKVKTDVGNWLSLSMGNLSSLPGQNKTISTCYWLALSLIQMLFDDSRQHLIHLFK